jgi:thioredoxin-like negative regulator of GroEL
VKFYKVDVDELPQVATAMRVSAMPTFQIFGHGPKLASYDPAVHDPSRIVGADPRKLSRTIDEYVDKAVVAGIAPERDGAEAEAEAEAEAKAKAEAEAKA